MGTYGCMARLKRVSSSDRGWSRRRSGRGFSYIDSEGKRLEASDVKRVRSLVIPPAWEDVWICPAPNGHLQATGVDAAGRRQYLYHPKWRLVRDSAKFERIAEAAGQLPRVRRRLSHDLGLSGMPLERACATAVQLLDVGYFRIGNDAYEDANGSFGLTTLKRGHVRAHDGTLVFDFDGKSGIHHTVVVDDKAALSALEVMRRRRSGGHRLLAFKKAGQWRGLHAEEVNRYLSEIFDADFTSKDFRTWHATVLAAEALALSLEPGDTAASAKRALREAVKVTSDYLGNTPTIARKSYIDPRIIDCYWSGETIKCAAEKRYSSLAMRREALESAVLELLR